MAPHKHNVHPGKNIEATTAWHTACLFIKKTTTLHPLTLGTTALNLIQLHYLILFHIAHHVSASLLKIWWFVRSWFGNVANLSYTPSEIKPHLGLMHMA